MKNRSVLYRETHPLVLNIYFYFYLYVFAILILANILPISQVTYFLFIFFGVAGISILLIKCTRNISLDETTIKFGVKILINVTLLTVKMKDIRDVAKIDSPTCSGWPIKKGRFVYDFMKQEGMTITLLNGKKMVVCGIDAFRITSLIEMYKENNSGRKT